MTNEATPAAPTDSPFIGPRPFSQEDNRLFFGRDGEARELLNILIAQRVVLMHAPSGAGKTSLLHARLIPDLGEAGYFSAPVIRVNHAAQAQGGPSGNRYIDSLLASITAPTPAQTTPHPEAPPAAAERNPDSLAQQIRRLLLPQTQVWAEKRAANVLKPDRGPAAPPLSILQAIAQKAAARRLATQPAPDAAHPQAAAPPTGLVLIFDQFEEVLTADPIDLDAKRAFFERLGQALNDDLGLWALFAMREDYVAAMEPYLDLMPKRLQVRYRLDLLDERGAGLAIRRPIELAHVEIKTDDVEEASTEVGPVDYLVAELRKIRLQRGGPVATGNPSVVEVVGPYVEPVQLQVVCDRFWARWRAAKPGAIELTLEDVKAHASVDQALRDYYRDRVRLVATRDGAHDISREIVVRQWIERQLITSTGIRGSVLRTPEKTTGLGDELIDSLIDRYLVRSDRRRGEEWLELTHDRLVCPILDDNAAWAAENLAPFQLRAALWEARERPDDLLLPAAEIAAAEKWVAAHPGWSTPTDQAFLTASRGRVTGTKYFFVKNLAIVSSFVAAIAILLAIGCVVLYHRAEENENEARGQAAEAARQKENAVLALQKFKKEREIAEAAKERSNLSESISRNYYEQNQALRVTAGLPPVSPPNELPKNNGFSLAAKRWQNVGVATLGVGFLNGSDEWGKIVQQEIKKIAPTWTEYANLNFDFETKQVHIAINLEPYQSVGFGTYNSGIGTDCLAMFRNGQPSINLVFDPQLKGQPYFMKQELQRVILRQFGHAIGNINEHNRSDRPISWNRAALSAQFSGPPNNWNDTTIKSQILDTYPETNFFYHAFDIYSIMMYQFPPGLAIYDDGRPFQTPNNITLSASDKMGACKMYPIPNSLRDAGVLTPDGQLREGAISKLGEFVRYTVRLEMVGDYTVQTEGDTPLLISIQTRPDPDHQAYAAEGAKASLSVSVKEPKTYFIEVRHAQPRKGTGPFSIRVVKKNS